MPSSQHNTQYRAQIGLAERLVVRGRGPQGGRRRYQRISVADRLAARTTKTATCWICSGWSARAGGYVQIFIESAPGGKQIRDFAHRIAYRLAHGEIPDGFNVLHRCDNPRCVNPAHLFLGTQADNIHDCAHKNRRNAFGCQKLHPPDIHAIRDLLRQRVLHKDIAARFGVARNTISQIASGVTWGWLPFQTVQSGAQRREDFNQFQHDAGEVR
jgi:HNH endonuclease